MQSIVIYLVLAAIAGFLLGWIIQLNRQTRKLRELELEKTRLEKDLESGVEKMQWMELTQEKLRETFKALSSDLLSANSAQFMVQAKEKLSEVLDLQKRDWGLQKEELRHLVDPLGKNLEELDKQIRQLEQKREGAYQALAQQLVQLGTSSSELQKTTINLTQALKSTTVRGRWGEVQLRRIVEMAGMVSYVDFNEQVSGEEGRPDMLVNLPNKSLIPVDAKAPMNAYLDAQELVDEDARRKKLEEHSRALRNHMKSLAQKAYWSQFERSPEFVVMVVPYDSGLTAAFERDGRLLEDALENKVMIVSPVSLLALLKVIAYGWMQLQLAQNAQEIAEQGKELYSRFVTFGGHLSDMGKKLSQTVQSYNQAVGSLESRVLPSVRRLKEMGAGSGELPDTAHIDSQTRQLSNPVEDDEK